LADWARSMKSTLLSIKTLAESAQDKFKDKEFGRFYSQTIGQEINKTVLLVDLFINFHRVSTPIPRTDTVLTLIEEALKKKRVRLEERKIQLFKQFEKDLPETTLPAERLKFVLDAVFEYATLSIPSGGSIGITTKTLPRLEHRTLDPNYPLESERSVEISLVLSDHKTVREQIGKEFDIPASLTEELQGLELRLVEQIVRKHQGQVEFKVNEKSRKALISIKLPAERRKVFYYEPAGEGGTD